MVENAVSRPSREPVLLPVEGEGLAFGLPTRRATIRLARRLGSALVSGDLILLTGALGAGKTFFVRALARSRGVEGAVTSPSFSLVHHLEGGEIPIVHADLYRLGDPEEVHHLGLRELRDEAAMLVEWGEPHHEELGGGGIELILSLDADYGRVASLRPLDEGGRWPHIARALRRAHAR